MENLNLLYVEDDEEALEDVVFLLKRSFSTIYTACDGEEGLQVFKDNSIDIVLLDINIPKINGLQLASKIRELDENIPIVFITAHSETPKLLNAIELQVISYIIKPFNIEELKSSILKAIEKVNKNIGTSDKILLNNNFYWDKNKSELYYKKELMPLTKNEILLVKSMISNRNRYFSAKELGQIIFSDRSFESNSIVQVLSRFKNKINKRINNDLFFIDNIYGQGYVIK